MRQGGREGGREEGGGEKKMGKTLKRKGEGKVGRGSLAGKRVVAGECLRDC